MAPHAFITTFLFATSLSFPLLAENTLPVVVGIKGTVPGLAGPAPQPVPANTVIKTPVNGAVMLVPVPGQSLFVDAETTVKPTKSAVEHGPGGGSRRQFACRLDTGHVHSSILAPKTGSSEHEIQTTRGVYKAKGTSWSTWTGANGDQLVVFAGVVTANVGGQSIGVAPGQVLNATGSGDFVKIVVIDLRSGRRLIYTKGSTEPESELASAEELKQARDLMESAMGVFEGTASADDKIGFAILLTEINKVLSLNLLPPLPPTAEWQLFPNQLNKGITTQETLASPEKPVN